MLSETRIGASSHSESPAKWRNSSVVLGIQATLKKVFNTSPYQAMFSTLNGSVCGYAVLCKWGVTVHCAQRWAWQGHFRRQKCILNSTGSTEKFWRTGLCPLSSGLPIPPGEVALTLLSAEQMQSQKCQNICLWSMWISSIFVPGEAYWFTKSISVEVFWRKRKKRETSSACHVAQRGLPTSAELSDHLLSVEEFPSFPQIDLGMIQSNFCMHFVNPTQTLSISQSSKRLNLLFPSGNWKNVNCRLLSCINKFELVHGGRGLDRHNIYQTVSSQFFQHQLLLSGKLWPALLTARLQRLIYTLTSLSNVCWILCLSCFNSALIERNNTFFFISFRLSCITKGIKCSQRPAMSLLNSCILVFAVNRSPPIFTNKNEGFG